MIAEGSDSREFQAGGCCLPTIIVVLLLGLAAGLLTSAASAASTFGRSLQIELGAATLLFAAVMPVLRTANSKRAGIVCAVGVGLIATAHEVTGDYVPKLLLTLGVECLIVSGLEIIMDRAQRRAAMWEEKTVGRTPAFYVHFR